MKKLILSAAIVLGSLTVNAAILPAVSISQSVLIQSEFTEVSADAVPAAVKSTLEKSFPNTKLEKAYKNEKNEYKLEISSGEKKYTIFTDASGNIIKK
ncbi:MULTISPECIES: PepSY-like domain-containing protein [Flavobacterium]|uniref:Putative beta-lactamase-inhibitor-like PepSY-like domain-containing protein n=1 Tax=Flavobacterium ginsengisoli TaxID=871694 RepID=A0ABP7G0P0_9FLAO|nr:MULTISPECIES: PepSY-like domain-containing protein [Flavobacterium]MBJ2123928.1 PepSY-like domain-containing protein [Flavobacterium sp. IB48]